MFRWIKNHKLEFLTGLTFVGSLASILSGAAVFTIKPVALHLAALGVVTLGMVTAILFGIIMLVQRERAISGEARVREEKDRAEKRNSELEMQCKEEDRRHLLAVNAHHQALGELQRIAEDSCQVVSLLAQCLTGGDLATATRRVDEFVEDAIGCMKDVFETHWQEGAACRICVKYLRDTDHVQVFFRDRRAGRVTRDIEPIYRVSDYTSLLEVFHGRKYFYGADLLAMAKKGSYKNPEPNWQSKCRTNLAVAIGKPDKKDGVGRDIIGFLTISSVQSRVMDEARDSTLALMFASQLYTVLCGLDAVRKALETPRHSATTGGTDVRRMDARTGDIGHA